MNLKNVHKNKFLLSVLLPLTIILLLAISLAGCSNEGAQGNTPFSGPMGSGMGESPMQGNGQAPAGESPMQGNGEAPMGENALPNENPMGEGAQADSAPGGADVRNGERIYFTATTADGERISYRGGPNFGGMMMGSYLTCAACHGPEAQGGLHVMHMQTMDAPAITYAALSGESGEHAEEGAGHTDEHGAYDLDAFRRAVVEGQHPDGERLDEDMPRWDMGENDLSDLFAFLKSISPPSGNE